MLHIYLFCLLLVGLATGHPVPASGMKLRKRASPLANSPGTAVVFTIAIVVCLALIIWALRKHYQQKYAGKLQSPDGADNAIPEVSLSLSCMARVTDIPSSHYGQGHRLIARQL